MEEVKVILVPGGKMPVQGTEEAACYDCYAREITETDHFVIVKLGFMLNLNQFTEVQIRPRSNTSSYPVTIHLGTGDSDFRGMEYQARFQKIPRIKKTALGMLHSIYYEPFPYVVGDRVCQIAIRDFTPKKLVESTDTGTTNRTGGFGSTGLKEVVTSKKSPVKKQ